MGGIRLMRGRIRRWVLRVWVLGTAGCLLDAGCIGDPRAFIQRELEVLLRPEANPLLIRDSFLVDLLGPQIIDLFS